MLGISFSRVLCHSREHSKWNRLRNNPFALLMYSPWFLYFSPRHFWKLFLLNSYYALFFVCYCEAFEETVRTKATLKIKAYDFRMTEIGKWVSRIGLAPKSASLFVFVLLLICCISSWKYFNKITIDCYFQCSRSLAGNIGVGKGTCKIFWL